MRISEWSSDVCSSDLKVRQHAHTEVLFLHRRVKVRRKASPLITDHQFVQPNLDRVNNLDPSCSMLRGIGDEFIGDKPNGLHQNGRHGTLVAPNLNLAIKNP